MKDSRRPRAYLGVILGLLISALALALALRWAGLEALKEALSGVDLRFVYLALLTFLLSMLFRVAAWRALLRGTLSFWRVFLTLNQGYLLNNILPWRLGELGRAILLGRRDTMTFQGVLATIFMERLYDIIIALGFFTALIPLAMDIPGASRSALIAVVVGVVGAIGVLLLVRHRSAIMRFMDLLPGGRERWGRHVDRFSEGLMAIRNPRVLSLSFGLLLVSWALAGLEYWFVLRSVLPEVQLHWAYFMLTITLLGVAVPSSPGYIGVFEAAGVLALSVFAVPQGQALAATLILHAMVYVISSGIGALAFIGEGEAIGEIFLQARQRIVVPAKNRVE